MNLAFFIKSIIATGTAAAAREATPASVRMPNLNPVPSTLEALQIQLDLIKDNAKVKVIPYGTITMEQNGRSALADMEELAPHVCAFSDDGKGVQTGDLMESAMERAKKLNQVLIVAHCEDESLLTAAISTMALTPGNTATSGISSPKANGNRWNGT